MIQLKKLTKTFGARTILNDISFEFKKGKCYGIVGENGAGKTTLFRCLTGLESYTGNITSELNPLKNHIGYLQTEPFFFEKMTGYEYIQLLLQARKAEAGDIASMNIFELPLNQYVTSYSTGMKKKLAITAILFQKNDILILDEPYNGVDIHSNLLITEIIKKLKSLNKTILISSHIFSTLSEVCDMICLLKSGNFIKTADKDDFPKIEQEMRSEWIGNKVDLLQLK